MKTKNSNVDNVEPCGNPGMLVRTEDLLTLHRRASLESVCRMAACDSLSINPSCRTLSNAFFVYYDRKRKASSGVYIAHDSRSRLHTHNGTAAGKV